MGRRQVMYILPRLRDCKNDLSKKWYVEYSYRNDRTGKLERFRIYEGINEHTTPKINMIVKHLNVIAITSVLIIFTACVTRTHVVIKDETTNGIFSIDGNSKDSMLLFEFPTYDTTNINKKLQSGVGIYSHSRGRTIFVGVIYGNLDKFKNGESVGAALPQNISFISSEKDTMSYKYETILFEIRSILKGIETDKKVNTINWVITDSIFTLKKLNNMK